MEIEIDIEILYLVIGKKLDIYNNVLIGHICWQCSVRTATCGSNPLDQLYLLPLNTREYCYICQICNTFNDHLPILIGNIILKKYLNKIILLNDLLIKDVIYYIGVKMIY